MRAGLDPLALGVVERLDIGDRSLRHALDAARRNGTDLGRELVAAKAVAADRLAEAMAAAIGLPVEPIGVSEIGIDPPGEPALPNVLRTGGTQLEARIYVAPGIDDLAMLARVLSRSASARAKMRLTTPQAIRRKRWQETEAARSERARLSLSADRPDHSARHVLTGVQGAALATGAIGLCLFAVQAPHLLLLALHVVSGLVFLAPSAFRFAAAAAVQHAKAIEPPGPFVAKAAAPPPPHPTYSILVALHGEAGVVAHLVAALAALEWPRSRLEVFLVCEADDPGTIAAVKGAIAGEPGFELVVVPVSLPRTKPKALNFALPLATGEFVVLYDAEDRPDPGQLEAAWQAFRTGDDRLACLQAELSIANGRQSLLAGLFAVEYAALFRGLLPWLASHGLPLPLGGTSNHFRRRHLLAVGAWDSHNVTEDADLGMRLSRHGYRIGTLASPTLEDAPTRWRVWHAQRTRWMKGWIQTYLVHMRDPKGLRRDLGPKGFAAFQILFLGMIASAIAHPIFIFLLGKAVGTLASEGAPDLWAGMLLALDLANVLGGTLSFVLLARATVRGPGRRDLLRGLVWLYPYWLLVSFSTLSALFELRRRPHHWAKTPHVLPYCDEAEGDESPHPDATAQTVARA